MPCMVELLATDSLIGELTTLECEARNKRLSVRKAHSKDLPYSYDELPLASIRATIQSFWAVGTYHAQNAHLQC